SSKCYCDSGRFANHLCVVTSVSDNSADCPIISSYENEKPPCSPIFIERTESLPCGAAIACARTGLRAQRNGGRPGTIGCGCGSSRFEVRRERGGCRGRRRLCARRNFSLRRKPRRRRLYAHPHGGWAHYVHRFPRKGSSQGHARHVSG